MRFLVTFLLLLNYCSCFSQVVLSLPEYDVVYRGYNNVLEVGTTIKVKSEFISLFCEGAELIHSEGNKWVLTPLTTNDSLEIRMVHSKTQKIIDQFIYKVRDLPDPELFVGAVQPEGRISRDEYRLFARYSDSPLKAEFAVTGGVVLVESTNYLFKFEGNKLGNDYLNYVKNVPDGTKIKIKVFVHTIDKLERVIVSEYTF